MTRMLFRKLLRDMRATASRIVLMIVAVGLSLTVFSAVLYTRAIVSREMGENYRGTNPASATLLLAGEVPPARLADIRARPDIADVTLRAQLSTQIQQPNGGWSANPVQLFAAAPEDPMTMAKFQVERGKWPPSANGILIERNALQFTGRSVGDSLVVKSAAGTPVRLTITGIIHDPSLAPARQEQKVYGYLSTASPVLAGTRPSLDELKIVVADRSGRETPSENLAAVETTASGVAEWLQRNGVRVEQIQVPHPGQHPHQQQWNVILLMITAMGGMALLLSAILVATMVGSLLTQQIPQIGVMKAIGARSSRIVQLYLMMTLSVAAIATAVALAPGIAVGRMLAKMLLTMLDMNVTSYAAPWWNYAIVITCGLALPPLMALLPVIRAGRMTVRQALDDQGVAPATTGSRLDRWLSRIHLVDRMLMIGLRNVFRRRGRLALSILLLAIAGGLFIGGLGTLNGLEAAAAKATVEQHWDVEFQLTGHVSAGQLTSAVMKIPGVRQAEAWTRVPTAIHAPGKIDITRTYPDQGHGAFMVYATPPTTSMFRPALTNGRWLWPGDRNAVVLAQSRVLPHTRVGDTLWLSLDGKPSSWHVVGIVKEQLSVAAAYVSPEGFAQATTQPGRANLLRIITNGHTPSARTAAADAVERALAAEGIGVSAAQPVSRQASVVDGHVYILVGIVLIIASVVAIVGCIGLGAMMSTQVIERTREFAVMHAIGARPWAVRRMVLSEGAFTALASCAVAVLASLTVTAALNAGIGAMWFSVPFRFAPTAVLFWITAIVLGAGLATIAPAARASRLTIREALAHV